MTENQIIETIINMEQVALEEWGKGNPTGFLKISAEDVAYFDPFIEKRIDNLKELTALYESIRGKVYCDRFELINPRVQIIGDAAILTFNYQSYTGDKIDKWNCTEVYRKHNDEWKIIQTHWSPRLKSPSDENK